MIDEMPDVRLYRLHGGSSWMLPADIYVLAGYNDRIRHGVCKETASGGAFSFYYILGHFRTAFTKG